MSRQDHLNDSRLASDILDADSPMAAKRLVEAFRKAVWNDAIQFAATVNGLGQMSSTARRRILDLKK